MRKAISKAIKFTAVSLTVAVMSGTSESAFAQNTGGLVTDNTGSKTGNTSYATGQAPGNMGVHLGGNNTGKETPFGAVSSIVNNIIGAPTAVVGGTYQMTLAPKFGSVGRNGLPPTRLDSFVAASGGLAWYIYGDEGTDSIPPIMWGFQKIDRINTGIDVSQDNAGLTTGHVSYLPDAWGYDEIEAPPGEWDMSGPLGGANPIAQTPNGSILGALNGIGQLLNGGPTQSLFGGN